MTQPEDPRDEKPRAEAKTPRTGTGPRTINAHDLFQGAREVWIEHEGVRYRLRITRRNNLMLDK